MGSIAVGGVKLFKGGEKAFETAEKIHKACRLISNGATFTRAGSGFIKSGEEIYKNYIKNGKPLDGNFALQAGSMVLNGVTMFFSGKAFIKDFKSMKLVEKMKNVAKKAVDSVKTDFKSFMKDNRGGVDLSFGNGKTPLKNANYAQKTYSNKFSTEGIKKYSDLAGEPINTIDDLANAINSGKINVSDLPVEYIVRDGNTLILNTRTSQALTQAGVPRSEWSTINQTGNTFFEDLLTGQLNRNGLSSLGTPIVRPSGGK